MYPITFISDHFGQYLDHYDTCPISFGQYLLPHLMSIVLKLKIIKIIDIFILSTFLIYIIYK